MKHVFFVFSHLTFYMVHQIVKTEHISVNDCFLLIGRDYTFPENHQNDFQNFFKIPSLQRCFAGINIIKTIKNVKAFDKIIDEHIDHQDFYAYIAGWTDDYSNLLVSKKNCKGYYIFEEGTGSYGHHNAKTFTGVKYWAYRLVLKNIFPRFYAIKESYHNVDYYKFKGFYASSSRAFPEFRKFPIKVIDIPFENVDLGFEPDAVLSIDPLYRFANNEAVKDIYSHLFQYLEKKNYKLIAYKFHPFFAVRPVIKKEFSDIIHDCCTSELIELGPNIVLENVLKTYKCDFYSSGSSVQIYGAIAGSKCYAFSSYLQKYNSEYDNSNFKDFVEEIEI